MGPSFDSFLLELRIFSGDAAKQVFCLNVIDFTEIRNFRSPYGPVLLHVLDNHLLLLERRKSLRSDFSLTIFHTPSNLTSNSEYAIIIQTHHHT